MEPIRQWISRFPDAQKNAVTEAIQSASLPKIRRALSLLEELDQSDRGPTIDVELLSTYNLEPFLPVLQLAINCLPSRARIHLAPLDNIEAYIAQSASADSARQSHARLVLWRVEEVLPELLYPLSHGFPDSLIDRVDHVIARVEGIVSLHQRYDRGIPLFLSTLSVPVHFSNRLYAAQHSAGVFASLARVNQRIYEIASGTGGVHVLDLVSWAAFAGKEHADATLDFVARQPLSAAGQVGLALFIGRCLRPLVVPPRKAIALDLDNTLWGGVIGEDGLEGVSLGHDFPGNVYLRIQRELLELRNRGVLLILVSKNNEADVRQAFESLPDMILKWNDFAAHKVNWNPKHVSVREAARELGLGLESFVFIDDSDYEREQIRQFLPEVLILNESSDALQLLRAIWETDAFDSLALSDEDRHRHEDYAVRRIRDVKGHEGDLESFLQSLEMEATIERVQSSNLERVVTMLGKTNQFNLTTRRHSRTQVQAMLESPGSIALALRLRDKFGDQGIIAVLLALRDTDEATVKIDSFLVSCRALGRGVEDTLWAATLRRAREQNVKRLEAEYILTPKNGIVADLYDRLGLQRIRHDSASTRFCLDPIGQPINPSWIRLRDEPNKP